jgi:hypothetical protein
MMVNERFSGPHEHFLGWKCIQCGENIEQVKGFERSQKKKAFI